MYNVTKFQFFRALFLLPFFFAGSITVLNGQCSPDVIAPVIVCPTDIITNVPVGTCLATVPVPDPVYSDNCPAALTLTSTLPAGNEFPLGPTVVGFTVTDGGGNTASCTVEVYVSGGIHVPVCNDQDTVVADISGLTVYNPADLLEGGPYNCSVIMGSLNLNGPATPTVTLTGTGNKQVTVWVSSPENVWNKCWGNVYVKGEECSPDITPPFLQIPADMTISTEELNTYNIDFANPTLFTSEINTAFGTPYHWDNCSNGNSLIFEAFVLTTYPDGALKQIQRNILVSEPSGLVTTGAQIIDVFPVYTMHIPAWRFPPDTVTDTLSVNGNTLLKTYSDLVFEAPCIGETSKIERTWNVIDWNLLTGNPTATPLPALDVDNDGVIGDPYDVKFIGDSLWLMDGNTPVQALVKRSELYSYEQIIRFNYLDTATFYVTGKVFVDSTGNCSYETGESLLAGWKVKAIGSPSNRMYETTAGPGGVYELAICSDDSSVEISLDVPFNYAGSCNSVFTIPVQAGPAAVQDLAVQLSDSCNVMSVDITTPAMRPCFNGYYAVNYCNYSTITIEDTYVEVALDSLIDFTSSTIPGNLITGNTFRFETGDLEPGACNSFIINYILDCDAELGATYCSEAHIFPEDPCGWNGPLLVASAACEANNVILQLKNIGNANMTGPLEFVVAEDLIMYMTNPFQLNSGQSAQVQVPADGSTWRISVPQVPGYPWSGNAVAVSEGCGGINTFGLVNQLPVSSNNPFVATNCTESTSSFDPNDKQAFPTGVGNEHFIHQNTDIEYLIRFQNTGSDTAFTVVIYDTLSPLLHPQSVRPGASSHDYDFDILDNNVLRFRFDHIMLPDSNVNEPASHGFVKFRVQQQADNPLGEVISNEAAIVFDFNDPIFTNTTWHTIGKDFLEVNATDPGKNYGTLLAYPNPSNGVLYLEMPELVQHATFDLTDQMGKTVVSKTFSGKTFRFEHAELSSGIYFFRVTDERGAVYTGKVKF